MRPLLMLAILCGLITPASAYETSELVRDARAYYAKVGTTVRDLTIQQEATFHARGAGTSGMRSTSYRKGDRWRVESTMRAGGAASAKGQQIETVTLFDGKDTWTLAMGMKSKLPAGTMPDQSSAPSYWLEPVTGSKVVGQETVNGRSCWIVESPAVAGAAQHGVGASRTWIDRRKFIYVQSEVVLSGKKVRSVFSDFRPVQGEFEIPHQIDVLSDGAKTMTVKIVKLSANKGLSDDLFDATKLAGGKTMDMDAIMKQAEEMKKKMESQYGKSDKR